jgi:hypothetical protein
MASPVKYLVVRLCGPWPEEMQYAAKCTGSPTRNVVKEWTADRAKARRFSYPVARSVARRNGADIVSTRTVDVYPRTPR